MKLANRIFLFMHFCATVFVAADKVYLKDGKVYENATSVRDFGDVVVFRTGKRSKSIQKQRIDRVVADDGTIIYENVELRVREDREPGRSDFIFFRNEEEIGRCVWNDQGEFVVVSGTISDGIYKQFYDSGKVRQEFPFQNNQLKGTCRVYYESGKVERESFFHNGREEGTSKLYYPTGVLKGVSEFKNGDKHGPTKLFYEFGALKAEMNFRYSKADGVQKMYYESGALETEVTFKDGKKDGPIKQFYQSGKLKMTGNFQSGKLHGEVIIYYESGRVKKRRNFVNGRILKNNS